MRILILEDAAVEMRMACCIGKDTANAGESLVQDKSYSLEKIVPTIAKKIMLDAMYKNSSICLQLSSKAGFTVLFL